ncbi:U6 snRNA phosphodiesterase isoform X2 [Sitophilus oryzae]|uniref:U6 snRNA phosphodiesterase n=1 Tax=Sitophilus oryzae TaxID=7048 RepID=A0A6J2YP80_SITOR|nr:U6 snRNA phosphodiesterase isoform X2 [Sitophilus oryzae]
MFGKGSLSLLEEYGGDSSDEEVPGPRVSVKRTYDSDSSYPSKRLPVPSQFSNKNENDYVDDPLLHEGRVRSFAHERGNWPSYICIPFEAHMGLQNFLLAIKKIVPEYIELKQCNDFHISLTKTVILRYIWITPFVQSVQEYIKCFNKFMIVFGNAKVYCNEEKTRTFIGIEIKSGYDSLLKIVENLNHSLSEYKLPPFYEDPSFHMSIAWCLGDRQSELNDCLPEINSILETLKEIHNDDNWYIFVEYLLGKIGNKQFQFHLR